MDTRNLEQLTVPKLRELARRFGVSLTGLRYKADIIAAIRRGGQTRRAPTPPRSPVVSPRTPPRRAVDAAPRPSAPSNFRRVGRLLIEEGIVVGDIRPAFRFFSRFKTERELFDALDRAGLAPPERPYVTVGGGLFFGTRMGGERIYDVQTRPSSFAAEIDGDFLIKETGETAADLGADEAEQFRAAS